MVIDGIRLPQVPVLLADLGNYPIILGRSWLAEQDI
jgi:hypothetical protein